jgi:hypothetical protein
MHPEINIQIAQLRAAEMVSERRHAHEVGAVRGTGIRGFFRRHRHMHPSTEPSTTTLVLLPPPREERAPSGHDQRVA